MICTFKLIPILSRKPWFSWLWISNQYYFILFWNYLYNSKICIFWKTITWRILKAWMSLFSHIKIFFNKLVPIFSFSKMRIRLWITQNVLLVRRWYSWLPQSTKLNYWQRIHNFHSTNQGDSQFHTLELYLSLSLFDRRKWSDKFSFINCLFKLRKWTYVKNCALSFGWSLIRFFRYRRKLVSVLSPSGSTTISFLSVQMTTPTSATNIFNGSYSYNTSKWQWSR